MSNQLKPLEAPYSEEVTAILGRYPQRGGHLLSLFKTFANSVRFLRKGVGDFLDKDSPLSIRQREIVILRTTANLDCEYEWGVHVAAFQRHAELEDEQVIATRNGSAEEACWTKEERLILRGVDDLCANAGLSDETRTAWEDQFSLDVQLEIIAICGNYHTIAFVANSAKLRPEAFGARFPQASIKSLSTSPA